eukprot:7948561-Alexandrium_andersonii.AAC.1
MAGSAVERPLLHVSRLPKEGVQQQAGPCASQHHAAEVSDADVVCTMYSGCKESVAVGGWES